MQQKIRVNNYVHLKISGIIGGDGLNTTTGLPNPYLSVYEKFLENLWPFFTSAQLYGEKTLLIKYFIKLVDLFRKRDQKVNNYY